MKITPPKLSSIKDLKEKSIDFIASKSENEVLHKDLVYLSNQFKLLQTVFASNTNNPVVNTTIENSGVNSIIEKILNREETTSEEANIFSDQMKLLIDSIDGLDEGFKLSVSSLSNNVKDFISDDRVSDDSKNKALDAFIETIKGNGNNNQVIDSQMVELSESKGNNDYEKMASVLNTIAENTSEGNEITFSSLDDLNKTSDDLVVTQEEFGEKLGKGGLLSTFKEKAGKVSKGSLNAANMIFDSILAIGTIASILIPIIIPLIKKYLPFFGEREKTQYKNEANTAGISLGMRDSNREIIAKAIEREKKEKYYSDMADKERVSKKLRGDREDSKFDDYLSQIATKEKQAPTVINQIMSPPQKNESTVMVSGARSKIDNINVDIVNSKGLGN